jgi:hypothetical protein
VSTNKIIYIGDSFCAGRPIGFTHTDVVKENFRDHEIIIHGYQGASWFYSRQKFIYDVDCQVEKNSITALVFFHTNALRLNNSKNRVLRNELEKNFIVNYIDMDFQVWAKQQWFSEIAKEYFNIPTIHYTCFEPEHPDMLDLLPGMIFTTPLIQISIGELTGTDTEIQTYMENDQRTNHLNKENNMILGQHTVNAINNYTPGKFEIDMSKFNIVNFNAHRYPNKGFGTQ